MARARPLRSRRPERSRLRDRRRAGRHADLRARAHRPLRTVGPLRGRLRLQLAPRARAGRRAPRGLRRDRRRPAVRLGRPREAGSFVRPRPGLGAPDRRPRSARARDRGPLPREAASPRDGVVAGDDVELDRIGRHAIVRELEAIGASPWLATDPFLVAAGAERLAFEIDQDTWRRLTSPSSRRS